MMTRFLLFHQTQDTSCAELHITVDPSKPIDRGWPAERYQSFLITTIASFRIQP